VNVNGVISAYLSDDEPYDGNNLSIRKKYDMISPCNQIIHGYGSKKTGPNFIMTVLFSCPKSAMSPG